MLKLCNIPFHIPPLPHPATFNHGPHHFPLLLIPFMVSGSLSVTSFFKGGGGPSMGMEEVEAFPAEKQYLRSPSKRDLGKGVFCILFHFLNNFHLCRVPLPNRGSKN